MYICDPLGSDFAVTLHNGKCEPLDKMVLLAVEVSLFLFFCVFCFCVVAHRLTQSEYVLDDPTWVARKLMERYLDEAKEELNLVREQVCRCAEI